MTSLRILAVCRTLPRHIRGGLEEASWNLARALVRAGTEVTLLTTAVDHRTRIREEDGVNVHEIEYVPARLRSKPRYRWWPYFPAAAARYARSTQIEADIVHSQSLYAAGFLRGRQRPPVVMTIHGTALGDYRAVTRDQLIQQVGAYHPRVALQWLAVRLFDARSISILRRVDAIVPVSSVVAEMLPGVGANDARVTVIPNGIDGDRFPWIDRTEARMALGLPANETILAFLGRVEEYKGVGRLFEMIRTMPDAHLVIAGEGSYSETLRPLARDPQVQTRVHILGKIPDDQRPLVLSAADLLCLPSQNEGQPVVLLEALAAGTPIAIARPWIPESLRPFAVIQSDILPMVQKGLVLSRAFDRRAARETVLKNFTWDHIARRYVELFKRLRASRPPLLSKRGLEIESKAL